ncbi:hypothetical protein CJ739_1434 [Mariniflexile rhizosphaerae]|uniref:hypothetical protein n=1 Tax=unclassified Mariniflexile TaxID=2643887 RepID=UPI000CB62804|nr:hypothetical protein [Mariniflexile sp. TRM1-10]AXP80523.1 hypothetical protein CJ739_1434 [Mariniflexile sp. TRM1-10]PLB20065.1 MAG: hypothetical protein TRG1_1010 [Flavobacteriaceae bacterium FS1-H7996/R]
MELSRPGGGGFDAMREQRNTNNAYSFEQSRNVSVTVGDLKDGCDDCIDPYSLHENLIQVLPAIEGSIADSFFTFLDGSTSRKINLGGRNYYVDNDGYLTHGNFLSRTEIPFLLTFFTPGAAQYRFASTAKGFIHYAKHVKNLKYMWKTKSWKVIASGGSLAGEFGSFSSYIKGAQKFFNSNGPNFATYINKQGTIFKMNLKTGHFGVADTNGIVQTFYKIETSGNKALNYFIKQVQKY